MHYAEPQHADHALYLTLAVTHGADLSLIGVGTDGHGESNVVYTRISRVTYTFEKFAAAGMKKTWFVRLFHGHV